MITANEAKRQAMKNNDNTVADELHELENQIAEAISDGRFGILNDGYLQHGTIEELKKLGYDVYCGSQYNELYYSISWG